MNPTNSDQNYEIRYQVGRKDACSQMYHLVVRPKHYSLLAIVMVAGIIFALLPGKFFVGLPFLLFPPLYFYFIHRMMKTMVDQHPEFLEEQLLTFNSQWIRISNSATTVQWTWSRVKGLSYSGDFLLIRTDQFGSGAIIPAKALDIETKNALIGYIPAA